MSNSLNLYDDQHLVRSYLGPNCLQSKVINKTINCKEFTSYFFSVNVSLSTSVKPVSRLVMPAGSCTVSNMESSLMARCPVIRPLVVGTTPSTPSSARLGPENTSPGPSSSTWNQLLSVCI